MDIITHGIAGYCVGGTMGLIGGVLPDATLFSIKRLKEPTKLYKYAHSLWFLPLFYMIEPLFFYGYLSHILIDIPTHNSNFSVSLFYPFTKDIRLTNEWEFNNLTFYMGFIWTIIIILILRYVAT